MSSSSLSNTGRPEDETPSVGQVWMRRGDDEFEYWTVQSVDLDAFLVHVRDQHGRNDAYSPNAFTSEKGWTYCGHKGPGKLPPFSDKPVFSGCNSCGYHPVTLPLATRCTVGFGEVTVTCDGVTVWVGSNERKAVGRYELLAREKPGDWRIRFNSAMSDRLYQRHNRDTWVLVFRGLGFA